ncbi:protein kinase [Archangium violaceum]|uniref:protein kinase domain-containing protein n=1 Tax=Archangium violaceum TaxID=83451 RepID=UPI00193B0EB7|nr:protein kinase [Archangium violaceum]QRK11525.1 protein kinase [Archangium violaceum]
MSFLHELPPVRRFRLPFTRRRHFFALGSLVYEALGSLGARETEEQLMLARFEHVPGPEGLCVIERLHRSVDSRRLRELVWEAKHALGLTHPGLLQMRQFVLLPQRSHLERPYAVLEYVGGRSLASVLKLSAVLERKPLSVAAACDIAAQVADALEHLHTRSDSRGWCWALGHGDISPSLIWLCPDGRVKLVGFGTRASRRVGRYERRREWTDLCRASLYAPSAPRFRELPACRVDLYSLAVVLLEMLVGQPLWGLDSASTWRHGLPPEEVDRRLRGLRLPSGLGDVIRDALRCEPSGPVSTAAGLREALRPHIREGRGVATELGWLEREVTWRVSPWEANPLSAA